MGTYISSTERFCPPKICGFSYNSRSCNFWVQSINLPLLMTSLVEFTPHKIVLTLKANHALYDVQLYSYHNLQSSRSCLYPLPMLSMISLKLHLGSVQLQLAHHPRRNANTSLQLPYLVADGCLRNHQCTALYSDCQCTDRFTDQADQVRISFYPMCTALSSRTTIDLKITTVKSCFGSASRLL